MSLKKFFTDIFSSTNKDDLIKSLNISFDIAEKQVIPMLMLNDVDYQDTVTYKRLETNVKRDGAGYNGQLIRYSRESLETLVDQREKIIKLLEEVFRDNIQAEGLDYRRANLIRLIDGYVFLIDYFGKFSFSVTAEAVPDAYRKKQLVKEYSDHCGSNENIRAAVILLNISRLKAKEITRSLEDLKDISFSVKSADVMAKSYGDKVDPLKLNILPGIGHLALYIGDAMNSWTKYRHERATHNLEATRLNVLYLERSKAGASPEELATIQTQIDFYNGRINTLEQKIEDMEDV